MWIILAFLLAIPAFGQTCDGNTAEVVQCGLSALKDADAELDRAYQHALDKAGGYDPTDVENLKDAQQKWAAYRDATCKAESGLYGRGTAGPPVRIFCLIRVTKQRIADLKEAYE